MLRLILAALLGFSAAVCAQPSPLALRMPERPLERVDWGLEQAVRAEMERPQAPVFGQNTYADGEVGGGTHILIGTALMIGSFWALAGVNDEENFYNKAVPVIAPIIFIGGAVEVGYGFYRVVKNWNSGFH